MIAIVTRLPLAMLLAFTVAVTCVHAQAPTPTAAPAADADRIAAAKELMMAMNIQEQFRKTTTAMKDMLTQQMKSQPGAEKMTTLLDKIFDPKGTEVNAYFNDAEAAYVAFFSERFTTDELKQITAFQASPVGKKMQASTPEMIGALGPSLGKFQESIKKQIVDELQAKPKQ